MKRIVVSLFVVLALVGGCRRHPSAASPRPASSPAPAAPSDAEEPAEPDAPGPDDGDPSSDATPPEGMPDAPVEVPTTAAAFRAPVETSKKTSIATRLADLSPGACMKELQARKLAFARSKQAAAGVATPLRSTGPLHGVKIVIPHPPSLFGVLDCRLALALADLAEVAAAHDVVEIQIDNTYRTKAHLPGKAKKSQHAYGLAADVTRMRLRDGTVLRVEEDWHATIGDTSCGPDADMADPTPASIALRDVVCDVARRGTFHHMLSPSYDAAHRNHLHLDIQRNASRQAMH